MNPSGRGLGTLPRHTPRRAGGKRPPGLSERNNETWTRGVPCRRDHEPYSTHVLAQGVAWLLVTREVVKGSAVVADLAGPILPRDGPH